MRVRDVLNAKSGRVITIPVDQTARAAVASMVQSNIGSLPVVDPDGKLVGVVSERDLLRELHERADEFGRTTVRAIMTHEPITCDIDDDVEAVMGLMSDNRIAKIPVINRGQLAGIISVGDVVKRLYERTQAENGHLMEYLHGPVHA